MPDVRMPDGTIIKNVPEGTTRAQLMARVQKAQPQREGGVTGAINNFLSTGSEMLLGGIEDAYNAASFVTDPIIGGAMNLFSKGSGDRAREGANRDRRKVVNAAERTFISQPNPVAREIGRIGTAAFLPVGKIAGAGKLIRGANRAIQGAVGGAGVREVDESAVAPAAIGAATNLVLPPIFSKVIQSRPAQAVGRAVSGYADNLLGHIPPPPANAPMLGELGRKAQARAARFKSLGVESPTTGMVTRDPAAYSFEQNTAKLNGVGDDLAQQMRDVETKLVEKGQSLVRNLGGAKRPEVTGKAVEDALDAKRAEMQQVTSRLYEKVRETRGDEAVGDLKGFREFIDSPEVTDNATFDAMRESVTRRLSRFEGGATVSQAEELRKFVGGLGSGIEPSVRMMRGRMIDALDEDVVSVVGDDAFKAARASARAGFEEFKKTFAGKLADEKIAPELLTRRILGDGVKLSDIRGLKQSLMSGTEDQVAKGQEAWRGLQAQGVNDLLTKSVDADGNLIGSVLSREFNKSAPKLYELLGPEDFKTLRRLAAATRDVKAFPAGHSVNTSNTAATLSNLFDNAPPKIKSGWLKLMGQSSGMHAAAFLAAGPAGNFALGTGQAIVAGAGARKAEQAAAEALLGKIRMAQSPEAAAAAIREAQAAASSSPAIADFLNRAGLGRIIGGTAATTAP